MSTPEPAPTLFDPPAGVRVIVYTPPADPPPSGPQVPRRPAAILPVLVCLPHPADHLPDAAAIRANLQQVLVCADSPDGTAYRTRGQHHTLLQQRPDPPPGVDGLVVRTPGQLGPHCLGGALATLTPPPARTPTGAVVNVITAAGVWLGFLPGRDHPDTLGLGPPPVTRLHLMPGSTVVIAIEATVPLHARSQS